MEMVFFLSQGCLKIRQTFRQRKIFLLPPTYLFSGFLSAACLSGQRRHKKKRTFKCGNDFLCVRGCELESHLLVLFSSWLENNSLFLCFPIIELFVRGSPTQTLCYDCFLATHHCKLISTANFSLHKQDLSFLNYCFFKYSRCSRGRHIDIYVNHSPKYLGPIK